MLHASHIGELKTTVEFYSNKRSKVHIRNIAAGIVILPIKNGHRAKRVNYRKAEVNHGQENQKDNRTKTSASARV